VCYRFRVLSLFRYIILHLHEILALCKVGKISRVPNVYLPDLLCVLHAKIPQVRC